jgi:hypothetical protein
MRSDMLTAGGGAWMPHGFLRRCSCPRTLRLASTFRPYDLNRPAKLLSINTRGSPSLGTSVERNRLSRTMLTLLIVNSSAHYSRHDRTSMAAITTSEERCPATARSRNPYDARHAHVA